MQRINEYDYTIANMENVSIGRQTIGSGLKVIEGRLRKTYILKLCVDKKKGVQEEHKAW